ncbi:hypothetical protein U5A82_17390 [Sphingobium sp. CR2-8]|uniref:hypothetical protein n=1 Tax=Sphingobium sp. CR2-8 TaxID=1306534 RepID=UPI002DB8E48B|nr:hypothetical protein [Sphingobium sp. CR2-8]MEC3912183.1 hypothetical protein [Sphingobium sp. CR2-8]
MATSTLSPEQHLRQAALQKMDYFAGQWGCSNRNWQEDDDGVTVALRGVTDGGEHFATAYEKSLPR